MIGTQVCVGFIPSLVVLIAPLIMGGKSTINQSSRVEASSLIIVSHSDLISILIRLEHPSG